MAAQERTLTEFLQHSGRVLAELGRGEIVLRRRDGDDLVLMTRGQSEALSVTTRVLAEIVSSGSLERAVAVLPWLALLDPPDRAACVRELCEVASLAVSTGELARLEETLDEWRATGLATWDAQRLRDRADVGEYTRDAAVPLAPPGA